MVIGLQIGKLHRGGGAEFLPRPHQILKSPACRDNKMRVLGQAERLSISDSTSFNYCIQKLLFKKSQIMRFKFDLIIKNPVIPIIPKFSLSIVEF